LQNGMSAISISPRKIKQKPQDKHNWL
jgi:hypothetical protein